MLQKERAGAAYRASLSSTVSRSAKHTCDALLARNRLLLSIAAQKGWKIHQYDVEQVFPRTQLRREMFVRPLLGFDGEEHKPAI